MVFVSPKNRIPSSVLTPNRGSISSLPPMTRSTTITPPVSRQIDTTGSSVGRPRAISQAPSPTTTEKAQQKIMGKT